MSLELKSIAHRLFGVPVAQENAVGFAQEENLKLKECWQLAEKNPVEPSPKYGVFARFAPWIANFFLLFRMPPDNEK